MKRELARQTIEAHLDQVENCVNILELSQDGERSVVFSVRVPVEELENLIDALSHLQWVARRERNTPLGP